MCDCRVFLVQNRSSKQKKHSYIRSWEVGQTSEECGFFLNPLFDSTTEAGWLDQERRALLSIAIPMADDSEKKQWPEEMPLSYVLGDKVPMSHDRINTNGLFDKLHKIYADCTDKELHRQITIVSDTIGIGKVQDLWIAWRPQTKTQLQEVLNERLKTLIRLKQHIEEINEEKIKQIETDMRAFAKLKHQNVVKYLGCGRGPFRDEKYNKDIEGTRGDMAIYMEYMPGGSLKSLLRLRDKYMLGGLPDDTIISYSRQILSGLEYLHQNGVLHRDIKVCLLGLLLSTVFDF